VFSAVTRSPKAELAAGLGVITVVPVYAAYAELTRRIAARRSFFMVIN
jgi:hypothetical protein